MNLVKLQDTKLVHNNHLPFLYTNKERSEREIKETIPFTIATKKPSNKSIQTGIYNGENTVSSISSAGKTEQLHLKG